MDSQLPKKKRKNFFLKRAVNGILTEQIWHTSHIPLCYFRIKMTRKLFVLKISCCLADYKVNETTDWLVPSRITRASLSKVIRANSFKT